MSKINAGRFLRSARVIILTLCTTVSFLLCFQLAQAGVIENALNLPGLEEVKNSGVTIELKELDDTTDANGKKYTVIAQTDGDKITLNSKVFNESSDVGAVAQHLLHKYTHIKLKHRGNCKENELAPRKAEADFWRNYKQTHPGAVSPPCEANENLVYANGGHRSDADILKDTHDDYGYPDDPDGKEKSDAIYAVEGDQGYYDLTLVNGSTDIFMYGGPFTVDADESYVSIGIDYMSEEFAKFTIFALYTHAPSVTLPDGQSTGDNYVYLDEEVQSVGFIDMRTFTVVAYLNSMILNDIYTWENPIKVSSHIRGRYDPISNQLSFNTLSFDFYVPEGPQECIGNSDCGADLYCSKAPGWFD